MLTSHVMVAVLTCWGLYGTNEAKGSAAPIHTAKSVTAWVRDLENPDLVIRHRASWTLVAFGASAVAPLLARVEDSPSPELRMEIVRTIGLIGPDAKTAIPWLTRLCESEDLELRRASASALVRIDSKTLDGVLDVLIDLLGKGGQIASDTAFDVGAIGPRASPAVPALLKLLEQGDESARLATTAALAKIGPAASEAIPALKRAAESGDAGVSSNAREALRRIEGSLAPQQ